MSRVSTISARLLEDRGLTRADLAARIGVNEATVSRFLRGLHTPTISMIEKIADEFGVSVDYLLGRTENPVIRGREEDDFYQLYAAYKSASSKEQRVVRLLLEQEE